MSGGTMSLERGILSLIILLNIPVSGCLGETVSVTCTPQKICALRESEVKLGCSYSYTIKSQQSFWFSSKQKAKWRNEEEPEDLALDSDYAGRVSTYRYSSGSILTITGLRESDSGEYHLMIITKAGRKYSSSTAVTLTVADLQMTTTDTDKLMERTLNCSISCSLTSKPTFYNWYENGQAVSGPYGHQRVLSFHSRSDLSSYSCSVSGLSKIRSSAACVFGENCWNVLYSDRRVCALEGSSVDFPCTYSYPSGETVNEAFWYYFRPKVKLTDLSMDGRFTGRVEFLGDKEKHCTLRIRNLTKSDSGQYHFRFITGTAEGFSGRPGVILNVTDLQVKMSPTAPSEGQAATLTCMSTCTLPHNPTYIWYKNGQPVTNKPTKYNKLYLESASPEDALQYSCALAVKGPAVSTVLKFLTLGAAVFLVLLLIMGWMWRRRKKPSPRKDPQESKQCDSAAVYSNLLDLAMTSDPTQREESDDIHYSSVHFQCSHVQKEAPPTSASAPPLYVTEDQHVQYAAVNFSRKSAAH